MLALWIIYAVIAVSIPIGYMVMEGDAYDGLEFVTCCAFGIFWPIYAPFVILWGIGKGIVWLVDNVGQ